MQVITVYIPLIIFYYLKAPNDTNIGCTKFKSTSTTPSTRYKIIIAYHCDHIFVYVCCYVVICILDVMEYYLKCDDLHRPTSFLDMYTNPPKVVLDGGEFCYIKQ